MKKIFFLILPVLMLVACKKPEVDVWQELTIKEDWHRSTPWHYEWNDDVSTRVYRWKFDRNCLHSLGNENQQDWSKLTGDAFNWLTNHENSARVAWRQPVDTIPLFELSPYWYIDGERYHSGPSITVAPDVEFETHENIWREGNTVSFYVVNLETNDFFFWEIEFPDGIDRARELGPYFGGNEDAPHDMTIYRMLIAEE